MEKEYVSLQEVARMFGLKRASLYFYIKKLGIETHKFPNNKHRFIADADVERIRQTRESPWKISKDKAVA